MQLDVRETAWCESKNVLYEKRFHKVVNSTSNQNLSNSFFKPFFRRTNREKITSAVCCQTQKRTEIKIVIHVDHIKSSMTARREIRSQGEEERRTKTPWIRIALDPCGRRLEDRGVKRIPYMNEGKQSLPKWMVQSCLAAGKRQERHSKKTSISAKTIRPTRKRHLPRKSMFLPLVMLWALMVHM